MWELEEHGASLESLEVVGGKGRKLEDPGATLQSLEETETKTSGRRQGPGGSCSSQRVAPKNSKRDPNGTRREHGEEPGEELEVELVVAAEVGASPAPTSAWPG